MKPQRGVPCLLWAPPLRIVSIMGWMASWKTRTLVMNTLNCTYEEYWRTPRGPVWTRNFLWRWKSGLRSSRVGARASRPLRSCIRFVTSMYPPNTLISSLYKATSLDPCSPPFFPSFQHAIPSPPPLRLLYCTSRFSGCTSNFAWLFLWIREGPRRESGWLVGSVSSCLPSHFIFLPPADPDVPLAR